MEEEEEELLVNKVPVVAGREASSRLTCHLY